MDDPKAIRDKSKTEAEVALEKVMAVFNAEVEAEKNKGK